MITAFAAALALCATEPLQPAPETSSHAPPVPFAERVGAERQAWSDRKARIREELAALPQSDLPADHWARAWAGTYMTILQPGGVQGELLVAPRAGVAFERRRTQQGWIDHAEIAQVFPGGVALKWAIEPPDAGDPTLSSRMHFMTWGDKRVMISEPSLVQLVNDLNEGGDGASLLPNLFQRTSADGELPRTAMERPIVRPDLPPEWRSRLFDKRVEFAAASATETSHADEQGRRRTSFRVTLSAGADRGVFGGMGLPFQRGTASGRLVIDKVDAATSEGTLTVWSLEGSPLEPPKARTAFALPGTRLPAPNAPTPSR